MKKILIGLVVVIIAIALISPYAVGIIFKRNYFNLVEAWNRETQTRMEIKEYHLGWFKSSAVLIVEEKHDQSGPLSSYPVLRFDQTIHHGPLVYDKNFGLRVAPALIESKIYNDLLSQLLGQSPLVPLLHMSTLTSFQNDYYSKFTIPPMSRAFTNGLNMQWDGIKGMSKFLFDQNKITRISSDTKSSYLKFSDRNNMFGLALENYHSVSDALPSGVNQLWNVNHTSTLANFKLMAMGKELLSVNGIQFVTKSQINNKIENVFDIAMSFNQLLSQQITIKPGSFDLKLENIDSDALANLIHSQQSKQLLIDPYLSLINEKTKLKSNLSLNTSNGLLSVNGEIYYLKDSLPKKTMDLQRDMMAQVDIRISKSLLDTLSTQMANSNTPLVMGPSIPSNLKDQINLLVVQGYLIPDKNDFICTILINKGVITVNGKPFPAVAPQPQMSQPQISQPQMPQSQLPQSQMPSQPSVQSSPKVVPLVMPESPTPTTNPSTVPNSTK